VRLRSVPPAVRETRLPFSRLGSAIKLASATRAGGRRDRWGPRTSRPYGKGCRSEPARLTHGCRARGAGIPLVGPSWRSPGWANAWAAAWSSSEVSDSCPSIHQCHLNVLRLGPQEGVVLNRRLGREAGQREHALLRGSCISPRPIPLPIVWLDATRGRDPMSPLSNRLPKAVRESGTFRGDSHAPDLGSTAACHDPSR
jgi:hypothetical protein